MFFEIDRKIARYVELARSAEWSLEDLQWSSQPYLSETFSSRAVQEWVSQLYHLEMFALEGCERALRHMSSAPAREFLSIQMSEEKKHAAGYRCYADKLGGLLPVDPSLKRVFDHIRS